MKFDKSQIMKAAWKRFKSKYNWGKFYQTFAECLKFEWAQAKEAVKAAAEKEAKGIVRMHYSEYKNDYSDCQTVEGSYDKRTKTIEVMTKVQKEKTTRNAYKSVAARYGVCPRCRTYCYGDCTAA